MRLDLLEPRHIGVLVSEAAHHALPALGGRATADVQVPSGGAPASGWGRPLTAEQHAEQASEHVRAEHGHDQGIDAHQESGEDGHQAGRDEERVAGLEVVRPRLQVQRGPARFEVLLWSVQAVPVEGVGLPMLGDALPQESRLRASKSRKGGGLLRGVALAQIRQPGLVKLRSWAADAAAVVDCGPVVARHVLHAAVWLGEEHDAQRVQPLQRRPQLGGRHPRGAVAKQRRHLFPGPVHEGAHLVLVHVVFSFYAAMADCMPGERQGTEAVRPSQEMDASLQLFRHLRDVLPVTEHQQLPSGASLWQGGRQKHRQREAHEVEQCRRIVVAEQLRQLLQLLGPVHLNENSGVGGGVLQQDDVAQQGLGVQLPGPAAGVVVLG